jgi:hypothetical protein
MKRLMLLLFLGMGLLSNVGCLAHRKCNHCAGPLGCRPCHLGWQRGGTDYQRFLGANHHGGAHQGCGHHGCGPGGCGPGRPGHGLANSQPAGAGPASGGPMAQVAYPYYTHRGPRDFFLNNPPTIGR